MLKVENLTSYYSNIKILKNLSFNLEKGKVLCLLGRNGRQNDYPQVFNGIS